MQKSTIAVLLGAAGAILGLKALYKVYKLDYELTEEYDDEGDYEDEDDDDAVVCVHHVIIPVPKCETAKSEDAEPEADSEYAETCADEAEDEATETTAQAKPKAKRTAKPKEEDITADEET